MNGELKTLKFNGKEYYYIDLGKSAYEWPSVRLWIHRDLADTGVVTKKVADYTSIAGSDRSIIRTGKNIILVPDKGKYVFHLIKKPGTKKVNYRFTLLDSPIDIVTYDWYNTDTSVNGIGKCGLITMDKPELTVVWHTSPIVTPDKTIKYYIKGNTQYADSD